MNIKESVQDGHKERIKAVKDWRRTTYVKMAEETGISLAIFRQISSGYLNISVKTATILSKTYAGLNMQWLLTGEGTMLSESEINKVSSYEGWSADQLASVVKSQQERIEELKETIAVMREQIAILKEQATQDALKSLLTKDIISAPVEQ